MPKNKTGGNGAKKAKKFIESKSVRLKNDNELYGKIIKVLGNCRFNVLCEDGIDRIGILRGKFRKKKYVNLNNIVLLEIWDFQNNKISIIDVYSDDYVKKLKKSNELPKIFIDEKNSLSTEYCSFDLIDYDSTEEDEENEEDEEDEEDEKIKEEINFDDI